MNSARKLAIAGLLLLAMAGCAEKKVKVAPAAQAQAPAKDAGEGGKAGALYPPPLITAPPQGNSANTPPPTVAKTDNPPPPPPSQPNAKKPASTRKPKSSKPSPTPATTTADASGDPTPAPGSTAASPPTPAQTQAANELAAASGEPAAVSPIGELSTGGAAGQSQTHKGTLDLINNTDNGVNAIKRTLNPQEQETITQIKAFLSKARAAFENNDFDGATTLATKAKLLLDELNKD